MYAMTRIGSAVVIVVLIGSAAKSSQRVPVAPTTTPKENLSFRGQPVAPSDVMFKIRRGPCFGECPVYSVTLHGDGRVDWKGDGFVQQEGELHGRIETEAVQMVLDRAAEMDFFEHAVSFDESGNDGSNCKLTLRIAGMERTADVPHYYWLKNWDGTDYADWKLMRDEVDLTRCLDALTESWRWIHTVEDAGHAESDETARWTEIPAGFSVGVRRHAKDTRPDYQVTIDSTGAGRWHGVAHVREIGDRTFAVPPGQMLLLANRARRIIGLGHDITLRYDEDSEITVFVHAAGTKPGPREERFWSEQQTKESTANSKAAALGDLIDVFARTSHFAGSWDEQQAAHDETAQAPK